VGGGGKGGTGVEKKGGGQEGGRGKWGGLHPGGRGQVPSAGCTGYSKEIITGGGAGFPAKPSTRLIWQGKGR